MLCVASIFRVVYDLSIVYVYNIYIYVLILIYKLEQISWMLVKVAFISILNIDFSLPIWSKRVKVKTNDLKNVFWYPSHGSLCYNLNVWSQKDKIRKKNFKIANPQVASFSYQINMKWIQNQETYSWGIQHRWKGDHLERCAISKHGVSGVYGEM